jgi:hypothetical protein
VKIGNLWLLSTQWALNPVVSDNVLITFAAIDQNEKINSSMNECFTKLSLGLSPSNPLFEDCKTFDYGHVDVTKNQGKEGRVTHDVAISATFKQHKVPQNYFENEPILELIQEFNLYPRILLIEPGYIYNWHRDVYRATAFNLMLTQDDQYLVMFAHEHKKDSLMPRDYVYFPYTRLTYEPNQFYLLNTQIPHNSINYGTESRYVLSMGYYELNPLITKGPITSDHYYSTVDKLKEKHLVDTLCGNFNDQ